MPWHTLIYGWRIKNMARTEIIRVRVTDEEKKAIEQKASALGLTMSEYLRMLLLREDKKI